MTDDEYEVLVRRLSHKIVSITQETSGVPAAVFRNDPPALEGMMAAKDRALNKLYWLMGKHDGESFEALREIERSIWAMEDEAREMGARIAELEEFYGLESNASDGSEVDKGGQRS